MDYGTPNAIFRFSQGCNTSLCRTRPYESDVAATQQAHEIKYENCKYDSKHCWAKNCTNANHCSVFFSFSFFVNEYQLMYIKINPCLHMSNMSNLYNHFHTEIKKHNWARYRVPNIWYEALKGAKEIHIVKASAKWSITIQQRWRTRREKNRSINEIIVFILIQQRVSSY